MHVYLREERVALRMEEVEGEGLVPEGANLMPIAFFVGSNPTPSFRALLPPETVDVLEEALQSPVQLGVLAEEPLEPGEEIRAMVGLTVPMGQLEDAAGELQGEGDDEDEPWKASLGDSEGWRSEDDPEAGSPGSMPKTALLAFAPLVRLQRRRPDDFGEELADLLESAISGATRPALEARIDRMLGDL